MEEISIILKVSFIAIALLTAWLFYKASHRSKPFFILVTAWMTLQFILVQKGFYADANAVPPRLMFQLLPAVLFILIPFFNTGGRSFIDRLDTRQLTLLHTVRILVEIVLYCLFIDMAIPQIMTFEGRNFDILAGLSAPVIYYFTVVKNSISKTGLLVWNIISLCLLFNILIIAVLSVKSPFQQFAIGQTNFALGQFPFNWLPSVVVPLVLFAHLATIRQLIINLKKIMISDLLRQ